MNTILILIINAFVGASAYLIGSEIGKRESFVDGYRKGLNDAVNALKNHRK